jgi:hypothetical protein
MDGFEYLTRKVGNETNVLLSFLTYSVFRRFKQAKFAYAGLVLSSRSQFLLLPQRSLKMTLAIKVLKIDLKIIIFLP